MTNMETLTKRHFAATQQDVATRLGVKTAKQSVIVAAEAAVILQTVASNVQRCWYTHLGRIVTKCLASVFDDPYEFKLVFKQLANRTQIQFLFERNLEEYDPMSATGGGVLDIASFGLRIAALMLSVQGQRKLLILDEPFKYVSAEYRPQVRTLLERLAEEFAIQMVVVTHMEELEMGEVVRMG